MDHILVIDNRYDIRNFLHEALAPIGYEVKGAHDSEEGIELLNNGYNFNLVITDINMPRINANAVAKHIKSSNKADIPIVAIIDAGNDSINRELFNFVLVKPFKLKTLVKVIRLFTQHR
jgi:two-component system cell cycle sensor histidine kinase/response regulator CckA